MSDFTVTIAGEERHEYHKPYTYVVSAENAEQAWETVRKLFIADMGSDDVKRISVEQGAPPKNCRFHWNDLR